MNRDSIIIGIGGIVSLLLQIIVAPTISVMFAMPNFILIYVGIVAMIRPEGWVYGMAFVLGLAYDLLGNNPVGLMAALLLIVVLFASRAFLLFNNDTVFIPLMVSMVSSILVEAVYAMFLLLFGLDVALGDALLLRALPCALYDCAMGLIIFPILTHFLVPLDNHLSVTPSTTTIRLR